MTDVLRIPPHSIPAEQALLGTILLDPGVWLQISTELASDMLYSRAHRVIFQSMRSLADARSSLDIITVAEQLERAGDLEEIGGLPYLGSLVHGGAVPENVHHYAKLIAELATLRGLMQAAEQITEDAAGASAGNSAEIMALALERIKSAQRLAERSVRWKTQRVSAFLPEVLQDMEQNMQHSDLPGITTGFKRLDHKTGGFQRGDLIVVAARPGAGKTALAVNFALKAERKAQIISTEQSASQITQRMLAIIGAVDVWKLRNPQALISDEWASVTQSVMALQSRDIWIYDAPTPSVTDIRAQAERLCPDIVFVDYIQRLKGPGMGSYERISGIVAGLKDLAREMNIPVVALAQVNRQGIRNAGMEHLKGSGDIEQEADMVIILEVDEENRQSVELRLDKNRHGPTGQMQLHFHGPTMRFTEVA